MNSIILFGEGELSQLKFLSSQVDYTEHHPFSSQEQWVWPNTRPEYTRSGQEQYQLYKRKNPALKKLRAVSLGNTLDL